MFREEQRFHQLRVRLLLAILPTGFLVLLIVQMVAGHPLGPHPLSNGSIIGWTIFLGLVYLRLITIKLVTEVKNGKLMLSLRGLWSLRKIPLDQVKAVEVVTYDPVADYGGYGIRLSQRGRAYIAQGDQGVRLTTVKGSKILVGSQRPRELVAAIEAARAS